MRLIQKKQPAKRRLVRLSVAAAALVAALSTSGCFGSGAGGVDSYQRNLSMGCKVTAGGVTICPGGRTAQQ
jgi:hypothetical protein